MSTLGTYQITLTKIPEGATDPITYCLTTGTGTGDIKTLSWSSTCTPTNANQFQFTKNTTSSVLQDGYHLSIMDGTCVMRKNVGNTKVWEIRDNSTTDGCTGNGYIKENTAIVLPMNNKKCLAKNLAGGVPALPTGTGECTCKNTVETWPLKFVEVSSTGSTAPAGSPSCDCADDIEDAREEGKKEAEDNFPFLAKKGGPLEWGWWIIIGLGVGCLIAIVATYFLASPSGK